MENYLHSFFVLIKTKSPGVVQNKKILIKIWKFHVKKKHVTFIVCFLTLLNQTKNLKIVPLKGFKIVDLCEILILVPLTLH